MPKRPGRKSAAQTPTPQSERIYGSSKNPTKSASSEKSASKIILAPKITKALESKLAEFKETHKTKKVSLNDLKAVYRRGLGAYSSSHRPTITGGVPNTRNAWAMARVNKFLQKAAGQKVKAAYVQDDDLLENGGILSKENRKMAMNPFDIKGRIRFIQEHPELLAKGGKANDGETDDLKVVTKKEEIIKYLTRNSERYTERDSEIYNQLFNSKQYVEQSDEIVKDLTKEYFLFYELNPDFKKIPLIVYENKIKSDFGEGEVFKYDFMNDLFVFTNAKEYIILKNGKTTPINEIYCGFVCEKYENKIYGALMHEYGHYVNLNNAIYIKDKWIIDNYEEIYKNISIYAGENRAEFLAEVFALKNIPNYNQLDNKIKQFIFEYYDNKVPQRQYGTDSIKMAKGGKTKSKAKGDCYVSAGDIVMNYMLSQRFGAYQSEFKFNGTPYLVHAEVAGQGGLQGIRYGHAWVEDDFLVYDYSNGRKIVFPKSLYYSIGDVNVENPKKYQKYTFEEAKEKMVNTGNYGCWDLEVEYKDGGLIAPNGKKSNLTPEQYKLVRTPEFKAWFGDWENNPESASKVVDENGEPLVVYHGSNDIITTFNSDYSYYGEFWFSRNKEKIAKGESGASGIKYIFPYFLNIKKMANWDEYQNLYTDQRIQMGYDGTNLEEDYIAYEPNQIKLADGTNTTFDGGNPDIRYADGGSVDILYHGTIDINKQSIIQNGIYNGMVSDNYDEAFKYAKMKSYRNEGSSPIVFEVRNVEQFISEPMKIETSSGKLLGNYFNILKPIPNTKIKIINNNPDIRYKDGGYVKGEIVSEINVNAGGGEYWKFVRIRVSNKMDKVELYRKVTWIEKGDKDYGKYFGNGLYKNVPVYEPLFKSKMVNERNQIFAFSGDDEEIVKAVFDGKKPFGVLTNIYDEDSKKEIEKDKKFFDNVINKCKEKNIAYRLEKEEEWNGRRKRQVLKICQKGKFKDLFDMDALIQDYVNVGLYDSADDLRSIYNRELSYYLTHDWDDLYAITGLILGIPPYLTMSILNTGGTFDLRKKYQYADGGETESEKDVKEIYKIQKMQEIQRTMADGGKIVSARITEMPEDYGDEMPKVYVTFEDGTEEMLFDYYPDEISFTPEEFVGLTPDEARHLKFEKDKHYLMYSNSGAEFKDGGDINFKKAYSGGYLEKIFELLDEKYGNLEDYHQVDLPIGNLYIQKNRQKDNTLKSYSLTLTDKNKVLLNTDKIKKITKTQIEILNKILKSIGEIKYENGGTTPPADIICVNCDWEWNTSKSDESDKYVCHKCGFDNTLFYTVMKETMNLDQIAQKHGVDMEYLQQQFEKGSKHEMDEHTKGGTEISKEIGETIALHHLEEMPDYYEKLDKMENNELVTNSNQDDEFVEFHEPDEQEIEYVKYSVWYTEPGETYDFAELSDAIHHIREKNQKGTIRNYDGKKIMTYENVQDVLSGKSRITEFNKGGNVDTDTEFKTQYQIDEFLAEQKEEADAILFSRRTQIGKYMIANAYIDMCEEKIKRAENSTEVQAWKDVMKIWQMTKDEIDDAVYMYEEGGKAGGCGCTRYQSRKNFAKGGLAYGNSHDKGGMPMQVKSTGQNIEIEGGEGVINKRSMQMSKKVEFEGKQMTPCEVISKINQMGGGVKFDCSDVKEIVEKDGEF